MKIIISKGILAPILYKDLFRQLLKREIQVRYRGSILGGSWNFIIPILLLTAYTIVFSVIFEARWGREVEHKGEFAVIFFSGLIVYNIIAEILNTSPNLVRNQPNLVKKIKFPLELLPWITIFNALFHALISIIILFIMRLSVEIINIWPNLYLFEIKKVIPITTLLLPIIWIQLFGWGLAIGWLFAAIGVYIQDLSKLTGLLTLLLMFLSPIFYPIERLPEKLRVWLEPNPLALIISQTRKVLLWGEIPEFKSWLLYTFTSLICAMLSYLFFKKLQPGFADVL